MRVPRKAKMVGSVCLYGTRDKGFGFLAAIEPIEGKGVPELLGDGELRFEGLNDAFWAGMNALDKRLPQGLIAVFAPGGERMASCAIEDIWPYYGALQWGPAPIFTIPIATLLKAAETPS